MSPRSALILASLALLGACATTRSTTTAVSGTPRVEPTPATVAPAPAPAAAAFDPTGRWNLVFDVGGQGLEVVLELVKVPGGGWGGTLSSQMGNAPLLTAVLQGTKMEATFTGPDGGAGSMTLNFSGTTVEGTWSASGMGSRLSGARP